MSRRSRGDGPGVLIHIWGRGIAKRSIFECVQDVRFFESRLAHERRRDRLRVHAFVMLLNHYHLFVTSPRGQVSEAMRVILNEYVRWFNRRRRRDGPLFRSRFGSRPVESDSYLWTLIRYIDLHSEEARIVSDAGLYPFGSACFYLTAEGPKWLDRELVEELLTHGQVFYTPELYAKMLARPLSVAERELVDLRMRGGRHAADPLDDLVRAGPSRVREWMVRKAANADGTLPEISLTSPSDITERLGVVRQFEPDWSVGNGRARRNGWEVMLPGILRETCRLSLAEVGVRLGLAPTCVQARVETHRKFLVESEDYSERAAALVAESLQVFAEPLRLHVDGVEPGGLLWTPSST